MKLLTKNGEHELSEGELQAYRLKFRTFDEQLGDIAMWLVRNPSRRPKDIHRFLNAWLKKPYRSKVLPIRPVTAADRRIATIASLTGRGNQQREYVDAEYAAVARLG